MKINNRNSKKLKIILIISAAVIILGAGSYTVFALTSQQNKDKVTQPSENTRSEVQPDPEPETKTGESIKNNNSDQPAPVTSDPTTNLRTLQLSVSADLSGSTLFIRGGINNSVEFSGTCYATLSGPNGENIRKDTTLLQNASTTDCATIQVPIGELAKGQWKITLNYSSSESTGTSNAFTIQI